MGQGPRIKEIGDESRRRILDAAESLFIEKGYAKTSFVDIAERSGISRGSIPWHFKNKLGLLMAVVERATKKNRDSELPLGAVGIEAIVEAAGSNIRQPQMALLHTLMVEACKPGSPIHDRYVAFHVGDRQMIASWLSGSREFGVDGIEDEIMAVLLYSMIIGIHVQWRVAPDHIELDRVLDALVTFLRAVLTPAGGEPRRDQSE